MEVEEETKYHRLNDSWCIWAHLPQDTNWDINSYKLIYTFNTIEELLSLQKIMVEKCIKNCMLFIMRKGIKPMWEDEENKYGGSFSFKIINKNVKEIWDKLSCVLAGETIFNENTIDNLLVNGITISPKKNFCIIKIWLKNCIQSELIGLNPQLNLGKEPCLFKKHLLE